MKTATILSLAALAFPATATLRADPLDPLTYTSLGALELTAGSYVIDSSVPKLTLQFGGPSVTFTGTLAAQNTPAGTPYWGFDPQVAVFDFDSIAIAVGVNLYLSGPNPVALLSRGSVAINGNVDASGNPGDTGAGVPPFGGSGLGGRGGPGGGGGGDGAFGSPAGSVGGDGHGPGGANGAGAAGAAGGANSRGDGAGFGGRGGSGAGALVNASNYGDLSHFLQGGAGGGGTGTDATVARGSGGGGGGGGIEIGAVTSVTIAGDVLARGGAGGSGTVHGGGGSGGGILLHAPDVQLGPVGAVNASGGIPNGGGGRIRILTSAGGAVAGNIAFGPGAPGGEDGVLEFGTLPGANQPLVLTISWANVTPPVLNLCWPAAAGVNYQLEGSLSAAATDWHPVGPLLVGNGAMHCVNEPVALVDSLFFRVRLVP